MTYDTRYVLLSQDTIDKIAAGEVDGETGLSIVKELDGECGGCRSKCRHSGDPRMAALRLCGSRTMASGIR